jgi:hypothetical protein
VCQRWRERRGFTRANYTGGAVVAALGECGSWLRGGPDRSGARIGGRFARSWLIDIEFASGARMRITGATDQATLTAAIAALASGRRGARVWLATGHTDMRNYAERTMSPRRRTCGRHDWAIVFAQVRRETGEE